MSIPCHKAPFLFAVHSKGQVEVSSFPIFSRNSFGNCRGRQNVNLSVGQHALLKCPCLDIFGTPVVFGGAKKYVNIPLSDETPLGSSFLLKCWISRKQDNHLHSCAVICCRAAVSDDSLELSSWRAELMFPMTKNKVRQPKGLHLTVVCPSPRASCCSGFLDDDALGISGETVCTV